MKLGCRGSLMDLHKTSQVNLEHNQSGNYIFPVNSRYAVLQYNPPTKFASNFLRLHSQKFAWSWQCEIGLPTKNYATALFLIESA